MEEVQHEDKTLSQAIEWVKGLNAGTQVTHSDIQIEFKVGYNRADRIFDALVRLGYLKTVVKGDLTIRDVSDIIRLNEVLSCEMGHPPYHSKEYCEELLKRFNQRTKERRRNENLF